VELSALVEKARAGDMAAFTALVGRFRHLAFGYALAHVRSFAVAEDVVQEAFVAAWLSLPKLVTPAAFPGWLRGIVGHCPHRVLRRRVLAMVPLDDAAAVPADTPGPADEAERRERRAAVLAAVEALPPALREVTLLHYLEARSHAEIATFLGIPATTVNNRLHAARVQLQRRMLAMMKDTLRDHRLPDDFPARVGRIVAAEGPVLEARFEPGGLPEVFTSLAPLGGEPRDVQVIQRLEDGRVLAIATPGALAGAPGARVVGTGETAARGLDDATLARAMQILAPPRPAAPPPLLETDIKVIDLLSPLAAGGTLGIVGDARVGTTVVVEELAVRLRQRAPGLTIFTFLPPDTVRQADRARVRAEGGTGGTAGSVQTFFLLRDRPGPGAPAPFDDLDAVVVLSPAMAAARIYPCVDPLASRSRLLDPAVVGAEHVAVAARVREALAAAARLEEAGETGWSAADRALVARVRRLRRFFGQPFFIAEPYTRRPGPLGGPCLYRHLAEAGYRLLPPAGA
jgi:RNA polymerase sigma factor (sigma-70 family)